MPPLLFESTVASRRALASAAEAKSEALQTRFSLALFPATATASYAERNPRLGNPDRQAVLSNLVIEFTIRRGTRSDGTHPRGRYLKTVQYIKAPASPSRLYMYRSLSVSERGSVELFEMRSRMEKVYILSALDCHGPILLGSPRDIYLKISGAASAVAVSRQCVSTSCTANNKASLPRLRKTENRDDQ
jgi:hypothetical protein